MIDRDLYLDELFGIPEKEDIFQKYYRIYMKINKCITETLRCVKKAGLVDESLASLITPDGYLMADIKALYEARSKKSYIDYKLIVACYHMYNAMLVLAITEYSIGKILNYRNMRMILRIVILLLSVSCANPRLSQD